MPKIINAELEKLESFLEKYKKIIKDKIDHYEEDLKSKKNSDEQRTNFQQQKQELETKIEKVKPYLAQLYIDRDKVEISKDEGASNKGKVAGTVGGAGMGAAGGAAAGAGAMVLLSPYTFGLSLSFIPVAATVGAIAGGLGAGTTGLAVGAALDKLSDSEKQKKRDEIKSFLEDYKTMITDKNEIQEIEAYIERNYGVQETEALIEST